MIQAPATLLPANEAERLHSLYHYDILQSVQEEVFDELVILSAHLFGLPISYIGLSDAHFFHFKAGYNILIQAPLPRQEVLCAQVIQHNRLVLYHDLATADQTPLTAPAIQQALAHQARFYVGAPLRTASQHAVGTLCLVGPEPRTFSSMEQQALEHIAGVVSQLVLLRHRCCYGQELGAECWQQVRVQVRDEVHALRALVRYLLTRYGATIPVPEEVLHLMMRRLQDLYDVLHQHAPVD